MFIYKITLKFRAARSFAFSSSFLGYILKPSRYGLYKKDIHKITVIIQPSSLARILIQKDSLQYLEILHSEHYSVVKLFVCGNIQNGELITKQ